MAENGPIEDIAKIVSSKLFSRFKWEQLGPIDQDFPCVKESEHKPANKKQKHTHPVDVVFSYKDPYLNKTIYLNTDLKSYGKNSINASSVESALTSLARTIDCATISEQWGEKYRLMEGTFEIRGLLFTYNHDNQSTKNFYEFFNPPKIEGQKRRQASVKLSGIPVKKGTQIHIIEPSTITYMMSVTADLNELISDKKFPGQDYGFYYPQLTLHKVLVGGENLPATIELLTSPFMIIKHGSVKEYNSKGNSIEQFQEGFLIYYNRMGTNYEEFVYFLDLLSKFQILDGKNQIRVRFTNPNRSRSIRSNFKRAIEKYSHDWGYDENYRNYLNDIDLFSVAVTREFYSSEEVSWVRE